MLKHRIPTTPVSEFRLPALLRAPTTGGHTAAPPRAAMKLRRLMPSVLMRLVECAENPLTDLRGIAHAQPRHLDNLLRDDLGEGIVAVCELQDTQQVFVSPGHDLNGFGVENCVSHKRVDCHAPPPLIRPDAKALTAAINDGSGIFAAINRSRPGASRS